MDANDSNEPTVFAATEQRIVPAHVQGVPARDLFRQALDTAPNNRSSWTPPKLEDVAKWLPQYRIGCVLGHGGMGAVYKGEQITLERPVAIKLLPPELAADAQFLARFQREAKVLARLQHPGIVAVHDFGQTSCGHLYFVMEFVDGTDLDRLIHSGNIQPAQALELVAQICEALHYSHSQGVVHRDIKPANVLIARDGKAKLADFGLALPAREGGIQLTRSNLVMGTPDYMAPEQRHGMADHRADIYAVGVIFYEMLTGERPHGVFDLPSQRVQIDARLDQVVAKALQQQPERRYQTASELKQDIDVIRATPQAHTTSPESARSKTIALIGIIALGLLVATGAWLWFAPRAAVRLPPTPTSQSIAHVTEQIKAAPAGKLPPQPGIAEEKRAATGDGTPAIEIRTNSEAKGF
jgi:serine/threonine protein kinase